jgi:hypothetical protein
MSAFQPNKFQPIWRYIQKDITILSLVVGSSRKSEILFIFLIFVPFLVFIVRQPSSTSPSCLPLCVSPSKTMQHIHVTCSSCSNLQLLQHLQHLDSMDSMGSTFPQPAAAPSSNARLFHLQDSSSTLHKAPRAATWNGKAEPAGQQQHGLHNSPKLDSTCNTPPCLQHTFAQQLLHLFLSTGQQLLLTTTPPAATCSCWTAAGQLIQLLQLLAAPARGRTSAGQ